MALAPVNGVKAITLVLQKFWIDWRGHGRFAGLFTDLNLDVRPGAGQANHHATINRHILDATTVQVGSVST